MALAELSHLKIWALCQTLALSWHSSYLRMRLTRDICVHPVSFQLIRMRERQEVEDLRENRVRAAGSSARTCKPDAIYGLQELLMHLPAPGELRKEHLPCICCVFRGSYPSGQLESSLQTIWQQCFTLMRKQQGCTSSSLPWKNKCRGAERSELCDCEAQ